MPIKYIGRKTDFKGKTLWEILGNLKDFGVGRIIVRNRFQKYPEPTYIKIVKVAALPNASGAHLDFRKVAALVQKTFRGITDKNLVQIDRSSYKADYILIPKDEEYKYCQPPKETNPVILPRTVDFPPLLKELVLRDMKAAGTPVTEEPRLQLHYNITNSNIKKYRPAKEGEKPDIEFTMSMGKPTHSILYANIKQ
ncbi:28S ribosomal protein S34, mitochondrial isoform X2 [Cephus cinctus]|uniref:28S ribosomal protein S34, mitochondrial isoform X2 n=1 Tax=Cephus cinctus TaxID=211228 RepID=A0AAJ7BP28_CEPCN|nr:28S ribosomal protein S34, mitochondrial isoform X2 [Cephus cinctus]